jgi:hypothetical protein
MRSLVSTIRILESLLDSQAVQIVTPSSVRADHVLPTALRCYCTVSFNGVAHIAFSSTCPRFGASSNARSSLAAARCPPGPGTIFDCLMRKSPRDVFRCFVCPLEKVRINMFHSASAGFASLEAVMPSRSFAPIFSCRAIEIFIIT